MKIIDLAFLCSSISPNNENGINVINMNTKFTSSGQVLLVLKPLITIRQEPEDATGSQPGSTQALFDEWFFQVKIKNEANVEVDSHSSYLNYAPKIITKTLDAIPSMKAGHYLVEIWANYVLEHKLDLFL